jgi:predicted ATPase
MKHGLKAITYTEPQIQTDLLTTHANKVTFSSDKVNVLIGSNGSGKSTLLRHLAIRFLCLDRGYTSIDRSLCDRAYEKHFSEKTWYDKSTFMPGITVDSAQCVAAYWAPGMKYGGWDMDTAAMMCGYGKEAKLRWEHTEKKSSGQGIHNQLSDIFDVLHSKRKVELRENIDYYLKEFQKDKLDATVPLFKEWNKNKTIVLLDEPEQSLDMSKEMEFWDKLLDVNTGEIQVIVATHSLYPLISPKFKGKFNYIEGTPDYKQSIVNQWNGISNA